MLSEGSVSDYSDGKDSESDAFALCIFMFQEYIIQIVHFPLFFETISVLVYIC